MENNKAKPIKFMTKFDVFSQKIKKNNTDKI